MIITSITWTLHMWPLFGGLLGTLHRSLCCTFCLLLLQRPAPAPAYPDQCLVHPADEAQPFHGIRPQWFTRLDSHFTAPETAPEILLTSPWPNLRTNPNFRCRELLYRWSRSRIPSCNMGTTVQCIQWWCCDVGRATTIKATTVLSVHAWRFVSLTPALGKHLYFDITTSQPLS